MKPAPVRAILFDWDGTLLNSAESSYRCYRDLFASLGIDFDRERFQQTYSPDWYRTYRAVGLPESRWAEADTLWLERYALEESRLVPGARDALLALRERSVGQGLVTSGNRPRVSRELAALNLEDFFGAVVCADEAGSRKPHPAPLLLALARLRVHPREAAYVGDSPEDIEMARAANVFAVGVPGGFPNRGALAAASPDLLTPSLKEAVEALLS
jgi:HAD superfamily hydrolase (TIGR01549 family)